MGRKQHGTVLLLLLSFFCLYVCAHSILFFFCLVHAKLKEETKKVAWRPDAEEEYEDAEGNVIPKKTYEDLVRQGIIQG